MNRGRRRAPRKQTSGTSVSAVKMEEVQRVRGKIASLILKESVEMAERAVLSVKESGTVSSLKYLWEVAGLFPAPEGTGGADDAAKALKLMQDLGMPTEVPLGPADDAE